MSKDILKLSTLLKSYKVFRSDFLKRFLMCFFVLFEGDRIIKVNGESVIGKTYSQVIALIQNR